MKKIQYSTYLFAFLIIACFSCKNKGIEVKYYPPEDYAIITQSLNLPEFPMDYSFEFPKYYRGGTARTVDKDLATLGRVLFYDKQLSKDKTVACASCHKQELAFSDNAAFSQGIEQRRTGRNSLALGAVFSFSEYYGSASFGAVPFFWDNRASTVQEQSIQTFANENEMGMEMHQVVDAVKSLPYYAPLFEMAFGNYSTTTNRLDLITDDNILNAINVFVGSIGSFNSKYDKALDEAGFQLTGIGVDAPSGDLDMLSSEENAGKDLYVNNCGSCHGNVNGVPGQISANNGLDMVYEDKGEGELTNNSSDMAKFKVPTLRNIMFTAPYMHDGRFETIEEVVDHYSNGVQLHPNLSGELRSGGSAKKLNFTDQEKSDLIAFLNTFTDVEFLTAEKYADPFK